MPRTFRLFSIRHSTTIIVMNSNVNMIQGDLRHMDRSTSISNRDVFNMESIATSQQLPRCPTTSPIVCNDAPTTIISQDPSAARQTQDTDRASGIPSNSPGTRGSRPVEMAASVHSTTSQSDVDEPHFMTAEIKKTRSTSVFKKVKRWIKKAL